MSGDSTTIPPGLGVRYSYDDTTGEFVLYDREDDSKQLVRVAMTHLSAMQLMVAINRVEQQAWERGRTLTCDVIQHALDQLKRNR